MLRQGYRGWVLYRPVETSCKRPPKKEKAKREREEGHFPEAGQNPTVFVMTATLAFI